MFVNLLKFNYKIGDWFLRPLLQVQKNPARRIACPHYLPERSCGGRRHYFGHHSPRANRRYSPSCTVLWNSRVSRSISDASLFGFGCCKVFDGQKTRFQKCFYCSFGAFGDPAFLSGKFGRKNSLWASHKALIFAKIFSCVLPSFRVRAMTLWL